MCACIAAEPRRDMGEIWRLTVDLGRGATIAPGAQSAQITSDNDSASHSFLAFGLDVDNDLTTRDSVL